MSLNDMFHLLRVRIYITLRCLQICPASFSPARTNEEIWTSSFPFVACQDEGFQGAAALHFGNSRYNLALLNQVKHAWTSCQLAICHESNDRHKRKELLFFFGRTTELRSTDTSCTQSHEFPISPKQINKSPE